MSENLTESEDIVLDDEPDNTVKDVAPVAESMFGVINREQIDTLVATAKKYPRSIKKALEEAKMLACHDEETAGSMHYYLKRQDKTGKETWIEGHSIRLLEVMAASWGNIWHGTATADDHNGKIIKAHAFCYDLERNHFCAESVGRRISGKFGRTYSDDMIAVTGQAAASIALRNAIKRVIPEAYTKLVGNAAKNVAYGTEKPLIERRQKMIERFRGIDVNQDQLLKFLGKSDFEQIGRDDLEKLGGVFTAIKDNQAKAEEIFPKAVSIEPASLPAAPPEDEPASVEKAKEELRRAKAAVKGELL